MAVNDSNMGMALILSSTCTSAEIQAYPYDGYHFVSWNDGNTDNPRTITVTSDAVYIASFAEDVSIDTTSKLDALFKMIFEPIFDMTPFVASPLITNGKVNAAKLG